MRVISRRIAFYILTAVAAVTVDFFIPRVMPGNPVERGPGQHAGHGGHPGHPIGRWSSSTACGDHQGLWGQYIHFWANLLHGDLGVSTSNGTRPR